MKLYVGTYHKYNCGSLEGKWLNLDDYSCKVDFISACYKLHANEKDPELMFQDNDYEEDWENEFYCECSISQDYWDVKDALKETGVKPAVFSMWCNLHSITPSAESVEECQEKYRGYYYDFEEYVRNYYEECGLLDRIPPDLQNYIDFKAIARDWDLNGDVHCVDGYVFDN